MKEFFVVGLSILLINLGTGLSQEQPLPHLDNLEEKIDAQVKKYTDIDIFSGVVLVAIGGQPAYHKAFGLANREKNTPVTVDSKFDIGSMNKTFTKILILQLVEENQLQLDDRLGMYLDGFPEEAAQNIQISHLLNHTSGYGDYFQSPDFFGAPPNQKTIPALVDRIRSMPLYFSPGDSEEYSNSGYILLGAIIEKVTGQTYHELVQQKILNPLSMNNTYVKDKHLVPDRAIGYYHDMKGDLLDNTGFIDVPNPDGGFQSTTVDILRFYREFHYGTRLLAKETKMKDEFYSMIQVHKNSGGAIPHAGGFNGANTVHFEILRDQISVVVFANMDEPVAEQLGVDILKIIRGQQPGDPQKPAIQLVYSALDNQGAAYVKENFDQLSQNFHPTDPKSIILNMIGYELLHDGDLGLAVEAFKVNTELFPEDPNVWDSYGEGLFNQGKETEALAMYKRALRIDPEFPSALEMVKKLSQ